MKKKVEVLKEFVDLVVASMVMEEEEDEVESWSNCGGLLLWWR